MTSCSLPHKPRVIRHPGLFYVRFSHHHPKEKHHASHNRLPHGVLGGVRHHLRLRHPRIRLLRASSSGHAPLHMAHSMNEHEDFEPPEEEFSSSHNSGRFRLNCPKCGSHNTYPRDIARRTGCAFGTLAGAAAGAMTAVISADVPSVPVARAIGMLSVAVIGGMAAGTAGSATGAALGEMVDRNILNNRTCLACGKHFRVTV